MDKDTATSRLVWVLLLIFILLWVFVVSAGNGVIAGISDPDAVITLKETALDPSIPEASLPKDDTPSGISASSELDDAWKHNNTVFVFFYADWCHFCHQEMPILDQLEQEYAGELAFIRINADESPEAVAAFEVDEFPTIFIISANQDGGYTKQKISGFTEEARLLEFLGLEQERGSDELGLRPPEKLLQAERSMGEGDAEQDGKFIAGSSVTCTSCEDCTTKLNNGSYDTVILSQNILNHTGNCITLEADNVVFDCSEYFISGDLPAAPFNVDYGIKVTGENNVITKCNVGLFWYGIWLDYANFTTITGNNMALNGYSGLTLSNSNNNDLTENTMNFNSYGLALLNSHNTVINSNAACGNLIADIWQENAMGNTGSNNTCYNTHNWNDTGAVGCTHLCCLVPSNDMRIEKDTKFCPGNYSINDTGDMGVIIINHTDITLDCNNASLKGDRFGVGIYNDGFDNVTIKNCNVSYYGEGIKLRSANYNNLAGNTASNNDLGIYLSSSSNHNTLTDNAASNNDLGIYLSSSSNHNTLTDNSANSSNYSGIHLYDSCTNNTLTDNIAKNNSNYGIYLQYYSTNNTLTGNTLSNNYYGIYLSSWSTNNTLTGNTATSNNYSGIRLEYSSNHNNLTGNIASNNFNYGIDLHNSSTNTLTDNTANSNNDSGIVLSASSNHNNLMGNTAFLNGLDGISLYSSSNNTLTGNFAHHNSRYGIRLYSSSTNTLTDNTANSNNDGFLFSPSSNNNTLTDNTANSNNASGIWLSSSSTNNTLADNTASNNDWGIFLSSSGTNTLTGNTASSNNYYGIRLDYSSNNNILTGNTASNNDWGIFLFISCNNNVLTGNTANANNYNGIYLYSSSNNLIYNNYFDNTNNAWDDGSNIWNITQTPGTNIIGGSWLGGNYWSDYAGTDTNGDGIGDTLLPYNSSEGIQNGDDWLPLVEIVSKTGDMNGDGEITFDDAILLAKHYYFGDTVCDDPDVTGDGSVTFDDAILLAKHYYFGDLIYP